MHGRCVQVGKFLVSRKLLEIAKILSVLVAANSAWMAPQRREVIESTTKHVRFTSTLWLGALFYRLFREYGNGIAWPWTKREIVTPKIGSDVTGTFDNLLKRTKHSLLPIRLYQCSWLRVVQARYEEPRGGSRGAMTRSLSGR
jgi:hypothetical protein